MTGFLDLLEAYQHWCVSGDRSRLERSRAWLAMLTEVPTDDLGWHRLGTDAIDWLIPLPVGCEPNWPMLSPREMMLTVEVLDYLETWRPGAIAGAFSQSGAPSAPSPPLFENVLVNWSLSDALACVEREVARCEAEYSGAARQGRLTTDHARQEIGQMKAAAMILRSIQAKGEDPRQETLL